MAVWENLQPARVFHFFEEMCAIPHGSRETKAVSDWCVKFAQEQGLRYVQDELNNVVIFKDGTPGYENAEPVILQGHLDMVCEKAPDCAKDMSREGLDVAVDGDWVYAKGTTLGGDDGIAVAMAMAVLEAKDIPHPPIEAVFTVDEEIGLQGAAGMDASVLKGRKFINIDSEEEGVFTVGCAGGNRTACTLPITREAYAGEGLLLKVSGLQGGHSGAEIDKGRANADVLMGRVLRAAAKAADLRICSVAGGNKDNAITPESVAKIVTADAAAVVKAVEEMDAVLKNEFRVTDPGVSVCAESWEVEGLPMDKVSGDRVICMLTCLPNGIQVMSADLPGLVQTSLNLGILTTDETEVCASFSVRSSVASQKEMLKERLSCLMEQLGGSVEYSGDYPAWAYCEVSPLRDLMKEVFVDQYGHEPKVVAIHAGLECGLFSEKLPGLDCVSVGPDLEDIHTPRERLSISSTQRLWDFLLEVLKRSK